MRKDPDVVSVASFVGAGTVNATVNTGRLYIALKPRDERKRERERRSSTACARRRETCEGISLFMQAVQDVQIDSRVSRTQYQYTLQDADEAELARMGAEAAREAARSCPNWPTSPATSRSGGLQVSVDVDRDQGLALQRHARRPSTTRSTTPSASARSRSSSRSSTSIA